MWALKEFYNIKRHLGQIFEYWAFYNKSVSLFISGSLHVHWNNFDPDYFAIDNGSRTWLFPCSK